MGMIIVFGSLNVDMMMPVEHFPKPGETILCSADYISSAGGKGSNQAVAAVRAGAKVAVVGKIGDDSFGRRSINNLKSQSILTTGIGISDRPTGCATIAVDMHGKNFVMVAPGANLDATSDQVPDEILNDRNILLAQLETSPEQTFDVIARARARKTITILNASPARHITVEHLKNIDYLIVNEIEALQLAHALGIVGSDPKQLAKKVSFMGSLTCIITLEAKGVIAARDNAVYSCAALPIEPVDTTGAGDAFCGIFAACLQQKMDWLSALHHASVGAGLSCLGLGAQDGIPFMEDIQKNINKIKPPAQES